MKLALFDLDNTLLAGDSDYAWGQFLVARGVVDGAAYEAANERFYAQYKAGELDIHEFARFAFRPLRDNPLPRLEAWRREFLDRCIRPMMLAEGQRRIDWHRAQGHEVVIITATNAFVTRPIAEAFGVRHLIATEPARDERGFTGEIAGTPCFQEGKVARLEEWLRERGVARPAESWFYSDSHNDLPLLERVHHPVAVDPDDTLARVARERGWPIRSFRSPAAVS